jgi:dynein assembly factor 5, axonemal
LLNLGSASDQTSNSSIYSIVQVKILQRTIIDPFPEVKKESCLCASKLAKAIPQYFHMQSESLIKPLLVTLTHQHSRVRIAAVLAIGM